MKTKKPVIDFDSVPVNPADFYKIKKSTFLQTGPVLRSRSTFDRLRLQVFFLSPAPAPAPLHIKIGKKVVKKHVFAFTFSHRLRLRPGKYRLRNNGLGYV